MQPRCFLVLPFAILFFVVDVCFRFLVLRLDLDCSGVDFGLDSGS
jgi:hypothetical protein